MAVLVTGCAGYIGSIASKRLLESNYEVIGIDNLSTGFKENIPEGVKFYKACISDETLVKEIIRTHQIDSVIHFAGYIQVGESVQNPKKYYENNLTNNIKFLNALIDEPINFVFSSSAAVYGIPERNPIKESDRKEPINPYGETKLVIERILDSYSKVYDLNYIALRYFNVAGAYGDYGECHEPETHLIPLVLDAALGKRDHIKVYGNNYATPDGTAIRDYIHVVDLIDAHILALDKLKQFRKSANNLASQGTLTDDQIISEGMFQAELGSKINRAYNLGYGSGLSVYKIIDAVKKISKMDFAVTEDSRRAGDPAELVADSAMIQRDLGWRPKYNDLSKIISDALEHRKKLHSSKAPQDLGFKSSVDDEPNLKTDQGSHLYPSVKK